MLNASQRRVNKNSLTWWYVLKTSWRCLEDVFQDVLKTFWRRLEDVLKTFLQDVLKASWQDVLKTFWKRLEDVFKMYSRDEYIGLDQDVFWRRKAEVNIFILTKTSWRRLHQDECLLGYIQWILLLILQVLFTLGLINFNSNFRNIL